MYLSRQQLRDARDPFAVEIADNCFEEYRLFRGDVVICDRFQGRDPENRQIVFVRLNGRLTFSRWDAVRRVAHGVEAHDKVELIGVYVTLIPGPR